MLFYVVLLAVMSFEERKLPLMSVARMALMGAEIDAIHQARVAFLEQFERLIAGGGEADTFPDFIEATGIAAIAANEVLASDAEPTGDPDVDGIRLGERTASECLGGTIEERNGHGSDLGGRSRGYQGGGRGLDLSGHKTSIAHNSSELMAGTL